METASAAGSKRPTTGRETKSRAPKKAMTTDERLAEAAKRRGRRASLKERNAAAVAEQLAWEILVKANAAEAILYVKPERLGGVAPPASSVPRALKKFKSVHKKGFYMVHCWDKLKGAVKWQVGYEAYKKAVDNGTSTVMVDGKDDASRQNALPPRPRRQKSTKADLAWEASAQALSDTLAKIMADSQVAQGKRDEKRCLDKVAANAIYLNLTKEVIEVQRTDIEAKKAEADAKLLDAEARTLDAEAKIRAEDTRIMLADLSSMDEGTKAWFVKKRAEIQARDA